MNKQTQHVIASRRRWTTR